MGEILSRNRVVSELCKICKGNCCTSNFYKSKFYYKDENLFKQANEFANSLVGTTQSNRCNLLSENGCLLPENLRPDVCRTYICKGAENFQTHTGEYNENLYMLKDGKIIENIKGVLIKTDRIISSILIPDDDIPSFKYLSMYRDFSDWDSDKLYRKFTEDNIINNITKDLKVILEYLVKDKIASLLRDLSTTSNSFNNNNKIMKDIVNKVIKTFDSVYN